MTEEPSIIIAKLVDNQIQPAIVHSCPNETVTFTCFGRQAMIMDWIMVPYIPEVDAKSFVAALAVNNRDAFTFTYTDIVFGVYQWPFEGSGTGRARGGTK